jgi:hypothetical protein
VLVKLKPDGTFNSMEPFVTGFSKTTTMWEDRPT